MFKDAWLCIELQRQKVMMKRCSIETCNITYSVTERAGLHDRKGHNQMAVNENLWRIDTLA